MLKRKKANMRKGLYSMKIIGKLSNPKILLIHGAGFYWKSCFCNIVNSLKDDYCLFIPQLSGHDLTANGTIETVEKVANTISEELYEIGNIKKFNIVYGISLGASIALELVLQKFIKADKLILDGGQYVSMGNNIDFFSSVMAEQFLGLLENRHLQREIRENMGYDNNDIDVLKSMLYKEITESTLKNAFNAAYKYDIHIKSNMIYSDVIVVFGSKEVFARKSSLFVKEKCIGNFYIKEIENMGHAEALSLHPNLIVELMQD